MVRAMGSEAAVMELLSLRLSQTEAVEAVEAHVAWSSNGIVLPTARRLLSRRCLDQEQSVVGLSASFRSGRVLSPGSPWSLCMRLVLHVASNRSKITLIAQDDLGWGEHEVCMRPED